MIKFFSGLIETVLLRIFIWTGTKIRAIHFGDSAESILESAKEMIDGSIE